MTMLQVFEYYKNFDFSVKVTLTSLSVTTPYFVRLSPFFMLITTNNQERIR